MPTKYSLVGIVESFYLNQRSLEKALHDLCNIIERFGHEAATAHIAHALAMLQNITTNVDQSFTRVSLTRQESAHVCSVGKSTIGSRLREERVGLKMTQQHFGDIRGVNIDAQYKYERGIRVSKADYMDHISRTGVDIFYITTGRRENDAPHVMRCEKTTAQSWESMRRVRRLDELGERLF